MTACLCVSTLRPYAGAPSPTSASGADNPPTAGAGAGQPPGADPVGTVAAVSSTGTSTQQSGTALQGLEERIAFLEMELLKQSLAAAPLIDTNTSTSSAAPPAAAAGATPFGTTSVTAREGRNTVGAFRRGVTLLSPAGAGAGHLNAAAEAAVQQQYEQQQQMKMLWTADSVLTRSGSSSQPWLAGGSNGGNAVAATSQLAAAAELGELDPEVLAIAEALAIRQGLGSLLPEPQGLELSHLVQQGGQKQMQLQDQQHRNSILGRTAWYSAPLQAHAWGGRKAAGSRAAGGYSAGGYGGPRMMTPSDYQADDEMVPYNPSGWAVAATFGVVYLGVIVTFLAMCVGDVPY